MPTVAKPNAPTKQIVAKPKPEWIPEFTAFKEICARNQLSMSEEIYERAIKVFLRDHHWPPGNSQTLLEVFEEKNTIPKLIVCEVCGEAAVYRCTTIFSINTVKDLCQSHTFQFVRRKEVISKKKIIGGKET